MEKLVMKADEAAEVLNVGKSTVYDLCDRGILPRIKKLPGPRFQGMVIGFFGALALFIFALNLAVWG